MTRGLAIAVATGLLAGCAPHHYTIIQAETVTLYLQVPEASRVQFASSLDRYTLRDTTKNQEGLWTISGLINREFQYFYLVDGSVFIPECHFRQQDDFGTKNCRYLP